MDTDPILGLTKGTDFQSGPVPTDFPQELLHLWPHFEDSSSFNGLTKFQDHSLNLFFFFLHKQKYV